MSRIGFSGRILVLGYGGVSQCTLPLLLAHIDVPPDRITILDFVDYREALAPYLARGVKFSHEKITRPEFASQLSRHVGPGDLIIDLAWNIECAALLEWCHVHQVLYVNTSVEVWDPYEGKEHKTPPERTLYARHMGLRKMFAGWSDRPGVTAVLDHGANPGLVSHFTRQALVDIGRKIVAEKPRDSRRAGIERALDRRAFAELAKLVGLKTIHISERDTQVSKLARRGGEFVNTWSVEGFYEEGTAPAEMGWGTHEKSLPAGAWQHREGPRNQICLERFGMNTFVRSRVPSSEIVGMVIRHGEAFSISESLTVHDDRGQAVYRPTVHYAYLPCEYAVASLDELREQNYQLHESWRIMNDDITTGYDEMGVLLMGHDFKSWWCGTILDIEETRRLVPGQNATTLQVAASVLAAATWMIANPKRGVLLPDELPYDEILATARPWLGIVPSLAIDWVPPNTESLDPASDQVWQFGNFLIEPLSGHLAASRAQGPQLVREFCDPMALGAER